MPTEPAAGSAAERDIEVLVVDDHRAFGDAIAIAVGMQPGVHSRGAVASAEAALELIDADGCPDVVLLDVGLPGMDGVRAVRALRDRCVAVRVVLITADTSATTLLAAVDAGAHGFLPKSFPFIQVLQTIRRLDQDVVAEPLTLERALRHATEARSPDAPPSPVELTDREYEILVLLADGMPVKQVAGQLYMSVNTCRGHIAALLRKFDVHSQLAAVVAAARLGMLPNLQAGDTPPRSSNQL